MMSHDEIRDVAQLEEDEDGMQFRKRRKSGLGDLEYQSPAQRRVSSNLVRFILVLYLSYRRLANENLSAIPNRPILRQLQMIY